MDEPIQSDEILEANPQVESKEKTPAKRVRKQATAEQLAHPLHGVKMSQILEALVDRYGWHYLASRVNINCFKYDPTMEVSLKFLRKTRWAREHVEDIYLDMIKKK